MAQATRQARCRKASHVVAGLPAADAGVQPAPFGDELSALVGRARPAVTRREIFVENLASGDGIANGLGQLLCRRGSAPFTEGSVKGVGFRRAGWRDLPPPGTLVEEDPAHQLHAEAQVEWRRLPPGIRCRKASHVVAGLPAADAGGAACAIRG